MGSPARAAVLLAVAATSLAQVARGDDTTSPTAVEIRSAGGTADGRLVPGDVVLAPVTQLAVLFSEPMRDPEGNVEPGDLTNPDSWLLASAGEDGALQTWGCVTGVDPDDVGVPIAAVTAWTALDAGIVDVAGLGPLPLGRYRLLACATLTDLAGNPLDGNGDGTGGDDLVVDFQIAAQELLSNPGFDPGLDQWLPG